MAPSTDVTREQYWLRSQWQHVWIGHLVCYMQTSCRQTSSERASTSGRGWQSDAPTPVYPTQSRSQHSNKLRKNYSWSQHRCSHALPRTSSSTAQQTRRLRPASFCAREHTSGTSDSSNKGLVVVIDNYDSFTYNICQVTTRSQGSSAV